MIFRERLVKSMRDLIRREDFFDYRRLLCFALVAVAMSVTGPYGTFSLPVATRSSYWTGWLLIIWVPTIVIFAFAQRHVWSIRMNRWIVSSVVFLVALPIVALCAVLLGSFYFYQVSVTFDYVLTEAIFLSPLLVGLVVMFHLTHQKFEEPRAHSSNATPPDQDLFFQRLPRSLGRNLRTISSADHYLDVRTDRGSALIHLSLKQAEQELVQYPGVRVHRGHWVAIDEIKSKVWRESRLFLQLLDGAELPVGRSYRAGVLNKL